MSQLLIVSGRSGSGKSIALSILEDLDYYCVDNLPLALVPQLTQLIEQQHSYSKIALGIDSRNLAEDFSCYQQLLENLQSQGTECSTLFLDAEDAVLLKRFSETRRKHPMSSEQISLTEAINLERPRLEPIAASASFRIDTSHQSIHQLRSEIKKRLADTGGETMVQFLSFGFKKGLPSDADFVFDMRSLPNPHWVPELRPLTGLDEPVANYLSSQPEVQQMLNDLRNVLKNWIPSTVASNRSYLTIAIGCTGGQHRSVFIAQTLGKEFADLQHCKVMIRHREQNP
ncbi:RNase adapter RapZ [Pelagibaculum spongiae]|uniref:RNase adapter RapZ n=1 Tax=Pelagibaculum spongiae TaxID=2080658 RepID=A0A2V1H585_9GAMM|nr:RNase adapter RapZ [Pelagibaculum spongiae]PVZ71925.1 RNase adapter RapZ [Pelagibaculum spongiae]